AEVPSYHSKAWGLHYLEKIHTVQDPEPKLPCPTELFNKFLELNKKIEETAPKRKGIATGTAGIKSILAGVTSTLETAIGPWGSVTASLATFVTERWGLDGTAETSTNYGDHLSVRDFNFFQLMEIYKELAHEAIRIFVEATAHHKDTGRQTRSSIQL